ncbi:MAG TPA: ABC transporter permease [Fimbriimonas sp.]
MSRFLQTYGVLVAFALLFIAVAARQPEHFLSPENLRNIANQNAEVGILAVGMTLVIIGGGIDLSVGSMMALVAAFGVLTLNKLFPNGEGQAVATSVAVCLGAGTLLGALNGLVIVAGRVAPFIATLVGLVAFRSVTTALADGGELRSMSSTLFPSLANGGIALPFLLDSAGRPIVVTWNILMFVLMALLCGFLLNWTRFGRHLVAVGSNERAAVYSAVPVARVKVAMYTLMGFLVGVAALGQAARMNSVSSSQLGLYKELDAIAAVVIGGTSMSGGKGRIWTTVVGVLLLGIITNMLTLENVSNYWQGFVKGVIILLAVLVQRGRADNR